MKKILLGLATVLVASGAVARPVVTPLKAKTVNYNQSLEFGQHRGAIYSKPQVSGPGRLEGYEYILRVSCGAEHELKCNYNIDLVDEEGTLKMNYLVGAMYDSKLWNGFEPKRFGKLNVIKEGEWFPSGTVGTWKVSTDLNNGDDTPVWNRGIRLRINLAEEGEPEKLLKVDSTEWSHGWETNIKNVEEYNNLSKDSRGRIIGGYTRLLKDKNGVKYIQSARFMPNSRFGEWGTMSLIKIDNRKILYFDKFGRIEGEKIFINESGDTVIPWRLFGLDGRNPIVVTEDGLTRIKGFTVIDRDDRYDIEFGEKVASKREDFSEYKRYRSN